VQRPAAIVALAAAFAYAALAGFPISTQRALVMLAAAMICQFWRRPSISFDAYVLALVTVAVFDPTALLTAGFWLSFCAVGWLLFIHSTQPPAKTLPRLLQLHVYLALGLTPLLGALHQSVPLGSPLANLVAVPVVTLVVVPLVIAGIAVLPFDTVIAGALWRGSAWVWELLWSYLSWLAQVVGSFSLPVAPGIYAIGLALIGVMTFFVPLIRMRWLLGSLLIAALALEQRSAPAAGQIRLTVVDVGQGLAVVVETAAKVLVYDTGAAFGRFSAGADILAPVLRSRGIAAVDRLILSHGDADHAGGWPGLAASLPVKEVWVSPGHTLTVPTTPCRAGRQWQWDGVKFTILYPLDSGPGSRNDRSCVLKVSAQGGSVLLPGDIEARAEARLIRNGSAELAADILLAPHHGSATSSTVPFVTAVDPAYVVFAAGYKNRFSFPRPQIVKAYLTRGVVPLTTGLEGAIEFNISDRVEAPRGFRRSHLRYWHHLAAVPPVTGR
jgi:competence protein ComEC